MLVGAAALCVILAIVGPPVVRLIAYTYAFALVVLFLYVAVIVLISLVLIWFLTILSVAIYDYYRDRRILRAEAETLPASGD